MKNIIKGLLLVAAMTVLGACGGGNDQASNDGAGGKQKITFWGSWSGDQVDQLNQLIDQYNDSQDKYEVTYKVQDNVEEKLLTGMAGGEIPDVILWDRVNTAMYAKKKCLIGSR